MKRCNAIFAIALSLVIGLASATAIAHSHGDHQDTSCSVSVLQNSSALVAANISKTFVANATTHNTVLIKKAFSNRVRGCQHVRAPPYNL